MLVAVYGTLKKGYGNNRLLSSSEFVCNDFVRGYWLAYSGSVGSFPVAIMEENYDDAKIAVEIWNIGDDMNTLRSLDGLEGVPYMYTREEVLTEDGIVCHMYVGTENCFGPAGELIPVPDADGVYEWRRSY